MEDTKNAVVTAKALITESLGMLNYGDITPDEHMKNLNKAKKVLTPKFMKGGSYKGKSHMYAAGGMVKELKI